MPTESAGLLMFRKVGETFEVLLAHPGGPFWANKDAGAWTIPKGQLEGEDALDAAIREFEEETGFRPVPPFIGLGSIKQKAGKVIHAWAFEGDVDPSTLRSNTMRLRWPPRSGPYIEIPEVDRCAWFSPVEAKQKINVAQAELIDRLAAHLRPGGSNLKL